jgi:long-chain acyl-CoA synthetase
MTSLSCCSVQLALGRAVTHGAVQDLVQREVDAVNARMPQVQPVRKFHLLIKEFDHDDGEVTATMKVRRGSITEKYAGIIEDLYA